MRADLTNIQSILFSQYSCARSILYFVHFADEESGRRFISALLPSLSFGVAPSGPPFINLSITSKGLSVIQSTWNMDVFESAYIEGPDATHLGDKTGSSSDPRTWWESRFATDEVHGLVTVYVNTEVELQAATAMVDKIIHSTHTTELVPKGDGSRLHGIAQDGGTLHFGYVDGLSKLTIAWDDNALDQTKLDFRHFVLGYSRNGVDSYPSSGPLCDIVRDSSYLVFRWIYQDVAAFNTFISATAAQFYAEHPLDYARELVAAKLMGRWRDGTPMVLSPDTPNRNLARADFDYRADPKGYLCPLSSHIRVANPREQPLNPVAADDGVPHLIRRGMPYGPITDNDTDDQVDRGVLGMFICANIRRQFYTIMKWMNRNDFSPVYEGDWGAQDGLMAHRSSREGGGTFRIPRPDGDLRLMQLPDFLHTKGTLLCLLASRHALFQMCQPL